MYETIRRPEKSGRENIIYELLKNQMLNLELKPGEMLSENSLAAQMNTGRSLVRDALAQLMEEVPISVLEGRVKPCKGHMTFVNLVPSKT